MIALREKNLPETIPDMHEVLQRLRELDIEMDFINICDCGAVTFNLNGERETYSMPKEAFDHMLGFSMYIEGRFYSCNYCVNHWGIDLCGCGSGEHYFKCKGRFKECGRPYQVLPPHLQKLFIGTKWDQTLEKIPRKRRMK